MTRKKKEEKAEIGNHSFSKHNEKTDTNSSLVLFSINHNLISALDEVLEAFRLSLPEYIRSFWEMFATECLDAGWWNPPLLVGPIGWEKDARDDKESFIAFLKQKKNHYQFYLNSFASDMLSLEEIISSPSAISLSTEPLHRFLLIPQEALHPWWHLEISEIVRNLQEGREVGFHAEQKGKPRPHFTIYYDKANQSWWSQFCWRVLLRDLFSIRFYEDKWNLLLPSNIMNLIPSPLKDDLISLSQSRWEAVTITMGVKVIGIDNILTCAIGELETQDPMQNDVFQIPWIEIERYLLEEHPSAYPLSVENPMGIITTSHYIAQQLTKLIRLILAQDPFHLTIILEQSISLDFGVFQEEADLRYDIATKKKLGELILEKIDREITSLKDSRISVEWIDSSGVYEVCSVCGLPYDGSCPHFPRHRIVDLTPDSTAVNIAFEVVRKMTEKTVKDRRSGLHRVAEYLIGDETGQVVLSVWDDDIEAIEVGKAYLLKGGQGKTFRSSIRLVRGRGTFLPLKEMVWLPKKNEDESLT